MTTTMAGCVRGAAGAAWVAAAALAAPVAGAQTAGGCAGAPSCVSVAAFTATVTDFRPSMQDRNTRLVALTVRFHNRTANVLRLAYVAGSGLVTDDQGNRYQVYGAEGVRGLGQITSNSFDPKFELMPGESSDARLEMAWRSTGTEVVGTRYTAELAVREIVPVGTSQLRLGREHALQFRALGAAALAAGGGPLATMTAAAVDGPAAEPAAGGAVSAASVATPAAAPDGQPAAKGAMRVVGALAALAARGRGQATAAATGGDPGDACAGVPRCYAAGPFTAQVTNLSAATEGNQRHHVLRLTVRLRNVAAQPLTLAYQGTSGVVTDELGNRYYWGRAGTYDMSASGIGVVQGRKADPQFVLNPGQSRDATFQLIRYNVGNTALGTTFAYDLTLAQLEVLNGGAIRTVRDYAVGFRDLRPGGAGASAASADPVGRLLGGLRKKGKAKQ